MKKILFLISIIGFISCKKDKKADTIPDPTPTNTNTQNDVILNFTNVAGNLVVKISTKDTAYTALTPKYLNASNDTFSITRLNYYISNIKLKRDNGYVYTEGGGTNSYHLLDAKDSTTCKMTLKNVFTGNYVSLEFMLGVDSLRNCSGAQTGALDPIHDMFWSWAQGYIFFKLEAYSSSVAPYTSHNIQYDIGGFSAPYNNLKTITLPLTTNLIVAGDHVSTVYLKANVLEVLKTPSTISFSTTSFIATPQTGTLIANNYVDLFTVGLIKN